MKTPFNKFIYLGFIALAIKSFWETTLLHSSLGIALAFDPFDPEQKWDNRPFWHKGVLLIHLAAVAALFGLGLELNNA
jgi:hypothetical protein